MREMMIDIETLDVTRTAVVPQVGYCVFQGETVLHQRQMNLRVQEQMPTYMGPAAGGRTISWKTLQFWLRQPDEARLSIVDDTETWPAHAVLLAIKAAAQEYNVERFWAKGSFDFDILEDLFAGQSNEFLPWDFRTKRDLRTELDHLPKHLHPERTGVAHTGLGDALYQHQQLVVLRRQFAAGNITR
jgi:hypothetical protein